MSDPHNPEQGERAVEADAEEPDTLDEVDAEAVEDLDVDDADDVHGGVPFTRACGFT